jgi:hypothetical protein
MKKEQIKMEIRYQYAIETRPADVIRVVLKADDEEVGQAFYHGENRNEAVELGEAWMKQNTETRKVHA